ncbi:MULTISPECIES: BON domain-containing protein [unclassified Acinetobacter]|uniref:BON domain-containing protein n=1 Tax=unclassified Acinetobacter TaxID=196816 RepID=UPI0035B99CF3
MKNLNLIPVIFCLGLPFLVTGCANMATPVAIPMQVSQQTPQDQAIKATALQQLMELESRFAVSRVNIHSVAGNVLLTGQVPDKRLKKMAVKSIKSIAGVNAVHDFITVEPQLSYQQIQADLAVTQKTYSMLASNPTLRNKGVFTTTENNVVYVMGRLSVEDNALLSSIMQQANLTKVVLLIDNTDQGRNVLRSTRSLSVK